MNTATYRQTGILNHRQIQILSLMSEGKTVKDVALELRSTESAIMSHLERIRWQLEAKNAAHAVAIALRNGWIN